MSNYPDGMTARDWSHVMGGDGREHDAQVECDNEEWEPDDLPGFAYCGFNGTTEVMDTATESDGWTVQGVRTWTCPRCKMEHEEQDVILEERDPDEGRD